MAAVALMDARSIAASAINDGLLTPATDLDLDYQASPFVFDPTVYQHRVYKGFGKAEPEAPLQYGPNITDWPVMGALEDNLLLGIACVIQDPVTTTDELIPSGDTSTYRSNPAGMAKFTLSRKDPAYVGRAENFQAIEQKRCAEKNLPAEILLLLEKFNAKTETTQRVPADAKNTGVGSLVYAVKPGDGSAREQAASCQRVLGGWANIAREYATRRYRSNLINWGMLPLLMDGEADFKPGDYIFLPGIRAAIEGGGREINAAIHTSGARHGSDQIRPLKLGIGDLSAEERRILLAGCLINVYKEAVR
jgi:aconitate hydratase